jgi:hypothetical protein
MASMVTASAGRRAATKRTALDETSKGVRPAAGALRRIGIKIVLPDRIVLDRDGAKERGIDTHDRRAFVLRTNANWTNEEPAAVGNFAKRQEQRIRGSASIFPRSLFSAIRIIGCAIMVALSGM